MKRKLAYGCCATFLALSLGCSNNDQQRAREKAAEAKRKVREEAQRAGRKLQKLGQDAKREAGKIDQNVQQGGGSEDDRTAGAQQKLDDAGRKARAAGEQAAVKLDRATMIAKVKAKLATDVGLSTAASVDVDTSGQVVTLRGTVASKEQKQQAERAVMQVNGVTKVINLLQVTP